MSSNSKLKDVFIVSSMALSLSACASTDLPKFTNYTVVDKDLCTPVHTKGFSPGIIPLLPSYSTTSVGKPDEMCFSAKHTVRYLADPNMFGRSLGMNAYMQLPARDQKTVDSELAAQGIKIEDLKKSVSYMIRIEQVGPCLRSYYNVPGNPNPAMAISCQAQTPKP